jgi:subtilisin family serine protease
MKRLNPSGFVLAAGTIVWLAVGIFPAVAQISPSFRPPMIAPITPIGPRDIGRVAPGNVSNIPMNGPTYSTGSNSSRGGSTKKIKQANQTKSVKQAIAKDATPTSKVVRQGGATGQGTPDGSGFNGLPPAGETRFVGNEVLAVISGNPSPQAVDALVRRNRVTLLEQLNLGITNSAILRLRIPSGRSVPAAIRAIGARIAQPNYLYALAQDASAQTAGAPSGAPAANPPSGDPGQYALAKLRLREAQGVARGDKVPVAILDSGIDAGHPDLAGAVSDQFDALGSGEPPHAHGTAVAGIVAAHGRLLGAAPSVNVLAVRAFGAAAQGADGTTLNILKGLDWASKQGARIINLSFTGPSDPLLARALAALNQKGTILIAAAGNAGPKSPPLYPAADPNVIAVSATDADDKLFAQSNRGAYIAVAAPGTDILMIAPGGAYQVSSGTSFAAAYVTGIAALMLERKPGLSPAAVKKALQDSAKDLGPKGRDDQFGAGLADAYQAVVAVDPSADASARAPSR